MMSANGGEANRILYTAAEVLSLGSIGGTQGVHRGSIGALMGVQKVGNITIFNVFQIDRNDVLIKASYLSTSIPLSFFRLKPMCMHYR